MPSGFTSLPFDVLLAICHEVDALSDRGVHKSTMVSTGQVVGRRLVANADIVPDSLLALSMANKRIRDASDPLIFGAIKFGSKWEGRGELRWAVAKVRMRGMIQKRSLRHTVRSLVWDCSSGAPWDSMNQSRPQFWTLFAIFMSHLTRVESVDLGFWCQQLDPYPAVWRNSSSCGGILNRTQQEQISQSAYSPSNGTIKSRREQSLPSCMPCLPSPSSIGDDDEILGQPSIGKCLRFPSIKTAKLRRGSQWFAAHCPNLEHFVDGACVKKWEDLRLATLGRCCARVQTLDTLLVACPDLISEILLYFPLLEELVVIAPTIGAHLGGWRIQDMAPLVGKAAKLRSLEFSRPTFKGLFPQKGKQFRDLLGVTATAFSEQSSSLLVLKLGEFTYCRTSSEEPLRMKQL